MIHQSGEEMTAEDLQRLSQAAVAAPRSMTGEGRDIPDNECEFCPDGHEAPERRPWAVYVNTVNVDHDRQPTDLIVCKTGGQHCAESDAEWLRQVIREARAGNALDQARVELIEWGTGIRSHTNEFMRLEGDPADRLVTLTRIAEADAAETVRLAALVQGLAAARGSVVSGDAKEVQE